jgi:hypothetical protein
MVAARWKTSRLESRLAGRIAGPTRTPVVFVCRQGTALRHTTERTP